MAGEQKLSVAELTDEQLIQRVEDLDGAAKEGPWAFVAVDQSMCALGTEGTEAFEGHVLSCPRCSSCVKNDFDCFWPSKENREFITEARTLLPELAKRLKGRS